MSPSHYVSEDAIDVARIVVVRDAVAEITKRAAHFQVLPDLWPLADAVAASSLAFSFIRMRNALPRLQV